jgi:NTP pyrophosphatase (non-canonical NTP hydrolase)
MTFDEYQTLAKRTAIYPDIGKNFIYPTLGLAGEAGEVANKVKKIFRDDNGVVRPERVEEIKKELGDVLWYLAQLSGEFGFALDDVARLNIDNLAARLEKGTLTGSGDAR